MKRIALLGATGSIGRQALEIIDAHPELELVAAASGSQPVEGLAPLTQTGGDLTELLERAEPDCVLNAVVGLAGIHATLWALERGVDLALANKESLVAAGELALASQKRGGGRLLPVDSEHSALHQCLEGRDPEQVASLVLTASGGPFRGRTRAELADVTPADALAHPTWNMGPKITVDSATLANKGLELIEAHFLFDLTYDQIDVGWMTTSMRSYGTSKRKCASISSRPLFASVAESIVIFGPMRHVGCASACSAVTSWRSSRVRPRNGPPDPVSTTVSTPLCPSRH